ncbi:unnamed protein product [Gordionus sp. m RMFG-2023]
MTMLKIILGISLFTTYSIHISQQVFVKAKPWFEEQKPTTNYRIYRLMKKPLIVNKDVGLEIPDMLSQEKVYGQSFLNSDNNIKSLQNLMEQMLQKG